MILLQEIRDLIHEHLTKEELIIVLCVISMFIPFYMCAIFLLCVTIYLLRTGRLVPAFKDIKYSWCLLGFIVLSLLTSAFHHNWIGVGGTIMILPIFCILVFYMKHTSKNLMELIIEIVIFMSILAALYGLFEYVGILHKLGIDQFEIIVFDARNERINSMFFNANYYAMMLEFFVLLCFYKMFNMVLRLKTLLPITYYSLVSVLNLFMLYLTGCRTAWPALAVGIFVLLYFNHHYKSVTILTIILIGGVIGIIFFPDIFPRLDNVLGYFFRREDIWITGLKALRDNWVVGQGPLTYLHVYKLYDGYATHHAHNILIDPFLSHGILGVGMLVPFAGHCLHACTKIKNAKLDRSYLALVLAMIFTIFIHGMTDYTIYFVQTSFLFFLIAGSYRMYFNDGTLEEF